MADISYEKHCTARGLIAPRGLDLLIEQATAINLMDLLYRPDFPEEDSRSLSWALQLLSGAEHIAPPNLLPLMPVDDSSIACAVCNTVSAETDSRDVLTPVIRWHLTAVASNHQGELLDIDAEPYIRSMSEELRERGDALERIKRAAEKYQKQFVRKGKRPRSHELRPVQLASQNVIVGLATLRQEPRFDGLLVHDYLTCEVPHLATHEANRALTALILCDAFQNGGTMEVRFGDGKREKPVPPALKRFARCRGIALGMEDQSAIAPDEARRLFLAVTPMPLDLHARILEVLDRGLTSPERICYTLLAPVWNAIELDYLLATSSRVASILEGGADPFTRIERLVELEVSRAALMVGVLHRHLNNIDQTVRTLGSVGDFEDNRRGITWTIDEERGLVDLKGVPPGPLAWSNPLRPIDIGSARSLKVIPRGLPTPEDIELMRHLENEGSAQVALLVPEDMAEAMPQDTTVLIYPDRLGDLDVEIERRLLSSRLGRS